MGGRSGRPNKCGIERKIVNVVIAKADSNYSTFSNWAEIKCGVRQGSILGPLFFLLYINDLSKTVNNKSLTILFADDASVLVSNPNPTDFRNYINVVCEPMNEWFKANLLSMNFNKRQFIQFTAKSKSTSDINITYDNKQISHSHATRQQQQ